jgi:N-acetylglutamate synthase-like GNAT family acetyltransferase
MTASSSLPPGFLLRPAKAIDKLLIGKLLRRLQQEIMPIGSQIQLIAITIALGFLAFGLFWTGTQWLFHWLFGFLLMLVILWLLLFVLNLKDSWVNFWVIEHRGSLVACAKLCQYETYSILYDLFVVPEWRKRGLGSHLVRQLGQRATKPLYLGCLPSTVLFYTRLGFTPVSPKRLPPIVRHDLGIANRVGIVPLVLR